MKIFPWLLLNMALACSSNNSGDTLSVSEESAAPVAYEVLENAKTDDLSVQAEPPSEQKIIKESYLRFASNNLDETYQNIIKLVKENNGYLQNDESNKGYGELTRRLVVKIPAQNFQKTIDSITAKVEYFDTKTVTATDVTEEFVDLEARLKAKRTLEVRYLELLQKANNVKEVLEIEKELSSIREEIEAKEGRLKYLQSRVAFSTISIEFYKVTSESGVTVGYGTKIWNALKSGFNGLSYFFLGLLTIWPFLLILGLIVYLVKRKFFRKKP